MINGVNYLIYILAGGGLVFLGGLEYFICSKSAVRSHRQALLFVPFLILCGALVVYGAEGGGSFLDLRGRVALAAIAYGFMSLAAITAGWLIYGFRHLPQEPEDCPFMEK